MKQERCYKILEVSPSASAAEIKQAYLDMVQIWHPDRFGSNPRLRTRAEKKLKEVNAAFSSLENRDFKPEHSLIDERRLHLRLPCSVPVNRITHKGKLINSYHDTILDISAGGLFVESRVPLPIGEVICLSFTLPRFGDLINLKASVVRQTEGGSGLRFAISTKYRHFLEKFIGSAAGY